MTRRDFLRLTALTCGVHTLVPVHDVMHAQGKDLSRGKVRTHYRRLREMAQVRMLPKSFLTGINYPWAAYGHDFGQNEWGHDGLATGGWTYQGFINARPSKEKARSGHSSLCVTADLVGRHPNRSAGEVFIDLRNHPPPDGRPVPLNLENIVIRCSVSFPPGSTGSASAPNGVQLLLKSEGFWSFYSPWTNIEPYWDDWIPIEASTAGPAGFKDPQFDPTKVIAVGLKVSINDLSTATLKGPIYVDDYVLDTDPPIVFDFETLEVERDFSVMEQMLHDCPKRVIRVFVFADGRAAPEFNPKGEVTGLDGTFFEDFDALLAAAKLQNLLLIPVLLDFSWCDSPTMVSGAKLGGHSDVIREADKRQTFLERALLPLLERYCDEPQILAWEVINEPEWAVREISPSGQGRDLVTLGEMQDFIQLCALSIHSCSSHQVTLGGARRQWLHYWQNLGLDLYQFHWYDHFELEERFPWSPYIELGLDKPCLIGEVPISDTKYSVAQYLEAGCKGGYHGLIFWSYRASDGFSVASHLRQQITEWCLSSYCR